MPPAAWHGKGRPGPCLQHSCHLQRSVGKSSPHEVIHMEHHICRIFILTCVRASLGCRQSLCLLYRQLEWGFHPQGERCRQRAWQGAHSGAGLGWGTPAAHPRLWLVPSWCSGAGALPCPLSLAAPESSQLLSGCPFCTASVRGQPEMRTTRGTSTERI